MICLDAIYTRLTQTHAMIPSLSHMSATIPFVTHHAHLLPLPLCPPFPPLISSLFSPAKCPTSHNMIPDVMEAPRHDDDACCASSWGNCVRVGGIAVTLHMSVIILAWRSGRGGRGVRERLRVAGGPLRCKDGWVGEGCTSCTGGGNRVGL